MPRGHQRSNHARTQLRALPRGRRRHRGGHSDAVGQSGARRLGDRHKLYEESTKLLLGRWKVDEAIAADNTLKTHHHLFGPDTKAALLRRLAREMQAGRTEGGALGNVIDEARVRALFTAEIATLSGFPRGTCIELAVAIIKQLHARNYILSFVGGASYAFLHRTFLEYFCAADIKYRFAEERSLSLDALQQLFVDQAQSETWSEVLRLLSAMLHPSVVAPCLRAMASENVRLTATCIEEVGAPPSFRHRRVVWQCASAAEAATRPLRLSGQQDPQLQRLISSSLGALGR